MKIFSNACSVNAYFEKVLLKILLANFYKKFYRIEPYCGEYCFEDWGDFSNQRRAYGTAVLTIQFVIPLSIIIICYTAISVRLGQSLLLKGKKRDYDWQVKMTDQRKI